jgi:hypothetical protein
MELLVILAAFGLSAGLVGRYRGSSFVLWFLIGFCLPLFGTVAAFLYRSERDEPQRECPECGEINPLWAQVCGRCGRDLEFPGETPAPDGASGDRW